MRFRKNPVEVEAVEVCAWDADRVAGWCQGVVIRNENQHCLGIDISTLEGTMRANIGDWIIKGIMGEFYPCKPDIFAATYHKIESEDK